MTMLAIAWLAIALFGLLAAWRGYRRRRQWLRELDAAGENGLMHLIARGYLRQRAIGLATQMLQVAAGVGLLGDWPWLVFGALFVVGALTAWSAYLADVYALQRAQYAARRPRQ